MLDGKFIVYFNNVKRWVQAEIDIYGNTLPSDRYGYVLMLLKKVIRIQI